MITLRDRHLEEKIDRERRRRGDATMAKTLADLAREKLIELELDGVYAGQSDSENTPSSLKK